jgi:hypothetical protein
MTKKEKKTNSIEDDCWVTTDILLPKISVWNIYMNTTADTSHKIATDEHICY